MKLNSFSEYLFLEALAKHSDVGNTYMALKFANLIRKPFNEWDAYKYNIIDNQGNIISEPNTNKELKAFGMFENLVRKVKKAIVKFAGDHNVLNNLIALYLLQKESYTHDEHSVKREILEELNIDEIELMESFLIILKQTNKDNDFVSRK